MKDSEVRGKVAREMLMHEDLRCAFLKGRRNGNWKKLARMLFIVLAYRRAKRSEGRKNYALSVVNMLMKHQKDKSEAKKWI